MALLSEEFPEVDFTASEELVYDGILDSLDIISIISEVSDEFDVKIPPEEITPENFNSAEAMMELINDLED